jgi:hypothetical protein
MPRQSLERTRQDFDIRYQARLRVLHRFPWSPGITTDDNIDLNTVFSIYLKTVSVENNSRQPVQIRSRTFDFWRTTDRNIFKPMQTHDRVLFEDLEGSLGNAERKDNAIRGNFLRRARGFAWEKMRQWHLEDLLGQEVSEWLVEESQRKFSSVKLSRDVGYLFCLVYYAHLKTRRQRHNP